jgi:hypothetical protein
LNDADPSSPQSTTPVVRLSKLGPRHKEVLALVAQGLGRSEVGAIVGYEPEYISWLVRQEVCQQYLGEMMAVVDYRLQAMTEESVDVIADVMKNGANDDRLKAAKLQLEATGRVGIGALANHQPASPDRLQQLADRLVGLLRNHRAVSNELTADVVDVEPRAAAEVPQ